MTTFLRADLARLIAVLALVPFTGPRGFAQGIPEPSLVLYGTVRSGNLRLTSGTITWRFQSATRTAIISAPLTNINDQFSYVLRVPCETEIGGFVASSNVIRLVAAPTTYDRSAVSILADGPHPATFVSIDQATIALTSRNRGQMERVDFLTSMPDVDADGNGLADYWERQYFGRIGLDPNADFDGDHLSNLAEYKAGTTPTDPNSCFVFIEIVPQAQAIRVDWSSVDGTRYRLQRASEMAADPANTHWITLQEQIPATPPRNTHLDTTATGDGPYFYRLQVSP